LDPFYFRTATVWHRAVRLDPLMRTVTALCGFTASYDRRNRKYEDTETRPYAGKVCRSCDIDRPTRVIKRSVEANEQTTKSGTFVSPSQLSFRKGKTSPTPMDTFPGLQGDQSPLGPGLSYDDAVRRKPRRILP
jgi:hypothetical protein